MTKVRTVRLECDGCGVIRQAKPGVGVVDLRLKLFGVGWSNAGNVDLCSTCQAKGLTLAAAADGVRM